MNDATDSESLTQLRAQVGAVEHAIRESVRDAVRLHSAPVNPWLCGAMVALFGYRPMSFLITIAAKTAELVSPPEPIVLLIHAA